MSHTGAEHLLPLLFAVALLIMAGTRPRGLSAVADALAQATREIERHLRVYSAETTRGKEAEFIRDRLPKRFPVTIVLVLAGLYAVAVWWLAR